MKGRKEEETWNGLFMISSAVTGNRKGRKRFIGPWGYEVFFRSSLIKNEQGVNLS
jgi:hypothetical protein